MKLGTPDGAEALRQAGKGGSALCEALTRNADRHARNLAPVMVALLRLFGRPAIRTPRAAVSSADNKGGKAGWTRSRDSN